MKSRFSKFLALALLAVFALAPVASIAATSGNTSLKLTVNESSTTDLGTTRWEFSADWFKTFANGSGINQANKVYQDKVTLAGSGATTYDLDSALTGPLGSVTFSRIYMIAIRRTNAPVATTQDEDVKIHGDFILTKLLAGVVDDVIWIPLRAGGTFFYISPDATGTAITATSGDALTLTNTNDSTDIEIVILGS